ncbi:MAG: SAM-dependent methyltransferase [Hyphomicrobiaceae bacterium]|jgi:SAM-dependent methyltransferase
MTDATATNLRENAKRRYQPSIVDTDWLVLKDLRKAIENIADEVVKPGMKVIDFGCGNEPYRQVFEKLGARYLGADYGTGHDLAISASGRVDVPGNTADVVLSVQVLEHVRDLDVYLGEARRLLKPDGQLILSTHGTWLYHPHPEDHRRWTRQGLLTDLEMRGFEVVDCVPIIGPLAWTLMVRLTSFAYVLRKLPIVGPLLAGCAAVFYNVRAILEDKITPDWVRSNNACVYAVRARLLPNTAKGSQESTNP